MGYWNDKSEKEKEAIWALWLNDGISPDYRNTSGDPEAIPDKIAMTYMKLAWSLRERVIPDREGAVEEMTKWLQSWMEERGHKFKDHESFKNALLMKGDGLMKGNDARAKLERKNEGEKYSDYCKHLSLMAELQSTWGRVGITTKNPLDKIRFAVIKKKSSEDDSSKNDPTDYNNETYRSLRNGTSETFWNHIQAGALANDIEREFLERKGEGLPTAKHLAEAVTEKVNAALKGIKDGSIKGTEGTLWIKNGAYMALSELKGVFKDADQELAVATNKIGTILREAGVEMDAKRVSPGKDEQLSTERMLELKDAWLQNLKDKGYKTGDGRTDNRMDSQVMDAYFEFMMTAINPSEVPALTDTVTGIKPSEIPAFTDMVQEWCRENGSLLANEGTGQIEFREKMLTEAMAKMMQGLADYANLVGDMVSIGPLYTASLEAFYKDEKLREIFGAGGVDLEKVFANAVLKTDSELIRHPTDAFPEKDLRERLESLDGMWNSINKNACINSLYQELRNILKDNTASEERTLNGSFEAIKRQVGEWTKERPRMNELEKNNPGTIKGCIDATIDICQFFYERADMPELGPKLKDAVSQHFAPDLNTLKRKDPVSQHFSPEPTNEEPANESPTGFTKSRRVRIDNGFGHKDYEHQFEPKSQDSMNIAKNKTTPSAQKDPEEPKVPKHPEKHTPSKSKDFLSR